MTTPPVLILDNGAYTIKAGFAGVDVEPRIFPNSIARSRVEKRVFVADEIDACRDLSGLAYRRPFERGMLVGWDAEKAIWDRLFSPAVLDVKPAETSLLVTEPYLNLPNIAETYDQIVFEEYEFASYYRTTPAALVPYGGLFSNDDDVPPECAIVVDLGYSYTHVIPLFQGQVVWEHVKRIDIGGKLLTNHLKDLLSFRQWNMMDQTAVVNDVREACSYVSLDWRGDLEKIKRNDIVQEYVLPDFADKSGTRTGHIRAGPNAVVPIIGDGTARKRNDEEQVLFMGNERFTGPELLFHPSDIGIKQSGLPETIAAVIASMDEALQGMYWAHIGLFGGLGNIEALGERIERDLRALCPTHYEVGIFEAYDPATIPYHAAQAFASYPTYADYTVSRAEYLEHGSAACRRRFGGPAYSVAPPGFVDGAAPGGEDADGQEDEDERERRYVFGLGREGKKGRGRKEEEEVTSGNWGGRRRRAMAV